MKKQILTLCFLTITLFTIAQASKTKGTKIAGKATAKADTAILKTKKDSLSYAVGQWLGGYAKSLMITDLDYNIFNKAMQDVIAARNSKLPQDKLEALLNEKMMEVLSAQAKEKKEEGQRFLAENKKRPGVFELPNGLQYEIIKEGTGPLPKTTDTIKAHYSGTVLNGKEFDNSYKRGEPLTRHVTGLIPGWTEALIRMPVGSKWKLYIPSSLAYGDQGIREAGIPGGATLIFEMELLEIVGTK